MTDATFPCVQCGSAVPRSAQFCLVCGTPVSSRSQAAALGAAAGQAPAAGADGRPLDSWRPTPAAPPIRRGDLMPSGYGRRVVAFLLDGVIGAAVWLAVTMPLIGLGVIAVQTTESAISVSGLSAVLLILPAVLYPVAELLLQAFLGFSLGKLALGLRIVNVTSLGRPGLGWMLLRDVFVAAASLVFFIGQYIVYLSPLWDSERIGRGWHDRLARTWVIDVKAGPNPLKARPGQLVLDEPVQDAVEPAGFGGGRAFTPGSAASTAAMAGGAAPVASAARVVPAPVVPAPVAPAPVAPVPAAPIDRVPGFAPPVDDDAESTRLSQPRAAVRASAPGALALAFRLDTGELIPIVGHGVLGRDPVSPTGDAADLVVALTGDTLSVSKTHLEFGLDRAADGSATAVWVSDRGSTNGTALVRADGERLPLDPGERIPVQAGDRVQVGTRVISVVAAGGDAAAGGGATA
ncbi:RDD family protein [Herbiconiux moechotypicola]|uniref:FHA domain-containing protein n=1 Tax=Herbiconiux moechotypicola TaxID=637393 RepID=A0ABP5QA14_9MICO|nr:RDD family protein [Herbiconiux moechotypicola]MCS5728729.1 RDD family protein [Herbiconiux moechotypicola]